MEPGDFVGGASEHLTVDSSLTVEFPDIPWDFHQGEFEPHPPKSEDDTSICVVKPGREVRRQREERERDLLSADLRLQHDREPPEPTPEEWLASIHEGIRMGNAALA